jgi:TolB-like protein
VKKLFYGICIAAFLTITFSCASFGRRNDYNFYVTMIDDTDRNYGAIIVIDGERKDAIKNGETRGFYLDTSVIHRVYFDYSYDSYDGKKRYDDNYTVMYEVNVQNDIHYWTLRFYYENDEPYYTFKETKIEPKSVSVSATDAKGIEAAAVEAAERLISDLTENSTLAVINIASDDRDISGFVVDELEYQLVNARKFKMADRNALDAIRTEQNFQLSGEVSDESAVSIGNMLGANIVITGTLTGTGNMQRLTIKALDVKTAQILSMARVGISQ